MHLTRKKILQVTHNLESTYPLLPLLLYYVSTFVSCSIVESFIQNDTVCMNQSSTQSSASRILEDKHGYWDLLSTYKFLLLCKTSTLSSPFLTLQTLVCSTWFKIILTVQLKQILSIKSVYIGISKDSGKKYRICDNVYMKNLRSCPGKAEDMKADQNISLHA